MQQTKTLIIPEEAFEQLAQETASDPVHICREFLLAKEAASAAEARKDDLKPLVEALRTGKETFFEGTFRNVIGRFKVNHVESSQSFASVEVLEAWLERGKISQDDFDEVVKQADKSYNLVTFKKVAPLKGKRK